MSKFKDILRKRLHEIEIIDPIFPVDEKTDIIVGTITDVETKQLYCLLVSLNREIEDTFNSMVSIMESRQKDLKNQSDLDIDRLQYDLERTYTKMERLHHLKASVSTDLDGSLFEDCLYKFDELIIKSGWVVVKKAVEKDKKAGLFCSCIVCKISRKIAEVPSMKQRYDSIFTLIKNNHPELN